MRRLEAAARQELASSASVRVPGWLASSGVVAGLLFVGALAVRLALAAGTPFPPLGDAAYYIVVARSLYTGHGFTVSIVGHYQPPPPAVTGPSSDYWGPLTSIVEWVSMLLFGNSLFAALVPGATLGAALVALTYLAGRGVFERWLRGRVDANPARAAHWLALGSALLLGVDALMTYQSVMGDSGMVYGLIAFAAILAWERALQSGRAADGWLDRSFGVLGASGAAWVAGALLGLAYLTRGSFIFLALAMGIWWLSRLSGARDARTRGDALRAGAAAGLTALVVVAPWLVRQQIAFGHMLSPEAAHNALAWSIEDFTDYGQGPTLATMLSHGPSALLALRWEALWNDWHHVTDYLFYPTALPALAGLVLLARRVDVARVGLLSAATLLFGFALIFPAVTLFGAYYHSVASVAPFYAWGALALAYAVGQWLHGHLPLRVGMAPALAAIPILLQAALLALAAPVIWAGAAQSQREFASIGSWLRSHGARVVMTNQSSTVNYATGIPAIELPAAQSPNIAYAAARRYGATYLVVAGTAGDYPSVLQQRPNPHFALAMWRPDYAIYQIRP
jgi:hypothetical protein